MLNYFCKTTTMSIDDFLKSEKEKSTLPEVRKTHDFINGIMSNDRYKKFIVVFLGITLYCSKVLAATNKGIDPLGNTLLNLIRHWAYWVILVMCILEVIRAGISGDSKKILSIIMKYVVVFASMYLVPAIFDAIRDSF